LRPPEAVENAEHRLLEEVGGIQRGVAVLEGDEPLHLEAPAANDVSPEHAEPVNERGYKRDASRYSRRSLLSFWALFASPHSEAPVY